MPSLALARHAMNTRFELALHGADPVALRAAGEEALDEIERLETRLSYFRPSSEISRVNARAAREPVRVTPEVFELLTQARRLSQETGGAFDITVAPLLECWGFRGSSGRVPDPAVLAAARARVGMHLLELIPENFTVRFTRPGVRLDLGAIGKGYAIDRAVEILREAGVARALIHSGTSTAYALGHPPEADYWRIAITCPRQGWDASEPRAETEAATDLQFGLDEAEDEAASERALMAVADLRDASLSLSAVWGRFFRAGGRTYGHVIDPRTGQPTAGALLAAVVTGSATESDALSTALLTGGVDALEILSTSRPGITALTIVEQAGQLVMHQRGEAITPIQTPPN